MKKILSIVLALAVVCGLAVTAWATGITVETDKDAIQAGEEFTITVSLDETIPVDAGAAWMQCDVFCESDALTYKDGSIALSEAYSFAVAENVRNTNDLTFYYINFANTDPVELPAGVIGTATYVAAEDMNASAVEAAFKVEFYAWTNLGDTVQEFKAEATVKVCSGHEWVEDEDKTVHATCTEAGKIHATCSVCGATKVEEEPALGHDFSDQWSIDSEDILDADGNVIGMLEHYGCWQCGQVEYSKAVYFMNLDENYNLKPGKTVEIAPGETIRYYAMGLTGYDVLIHGTDLSVKVIVPGGWISEGTEYTCEPVNGVVTIPVEGFEVFIEITNNGSAAAAYDMEVLIPLGDWTKPAELVPGSNTIILEPGHMNQYYTKFIAACDGEITFTVTGDYWRYVITNYGADKVEWEDDTYYNGQAFDDEYGDNSNTMTIPVKAGDLIEIVLDAYYVEDWEWYYPGSTLTVDVAPAYTHDGYITAVEAKDATCTEAGHIAHWICGCCGATFSDEALTQPVEDVTVPATGHTIVWTETKAPTCTEPGEETGTCHCGITETREIPATGHTFGEWTETKAPTCTEPGEETRSCACGETETREIPVIAHTFGEWTEVKAPSCTAAGEEKHVCSCGHEETREIPATGHNYVDGTCSGCQAKDPDYVQPDEVVTDIIGGDNTPSTGTSDWSSVDTTNNGGELETDFIVEGGTLVFEVSGTDITYAHIKFDDVQIDLPIEDAVDNGDGTYTFEITYEELVENYGSTDFSDLGTISVATTTTESGSATIGGLTYVAPNPKSGDTTISLVVAAAIVSALSIVALPLVKKHF